MIKELKMIRKRNSKLSRLNKKREKMRMRKPLFNKCKNKNKLNQLNLKPPELNLSGRPKLKLLSILLTRIQN
jgi:hypothetical protein